MTELLLGCGHTRDKRACHPEKFLEWDNLVTLDINPDCKPDLQCDLSNEHWYCRAMTSIGEKCVQWEHRAAPLLDNFFTEVHAYEVLEHLGTQGDYASFFNTFDNIWRILVPGGLLFATCPSRRSAWAWGDPGHTRLIQPETLAFLDQSEYAFQVGKTSMTDYRHIWRRDFKCMSSTDDGETHRFVLQAIKPARLSN
jgi:Methyltransferase domain